MRKLLLLAAIMGGCSRPCPTKPVQTQPVCDTFGVKELPFYNCSMNDVDYLCIFVVDGFKCWVVDTHDLGYTPDPNPPVREHAPGM